MNGQSTQIFRVVKVFFYDTIMVDTYHYMFVKTYRMYNTILRVNRKASCGLWVMIYHCRFIDCNKCRTLLQDIDNRRGCASVGTGDMGPLHTFCLVLL